MSAEKVLVVAVEQRLIEAKVADQLRPQLAQSKNPITAEGLVKFLVDKGLITGAQGKRILAEIGPTAPPPKPAPPPPADEEEIVELEAVPAPPKTPPVAKPPAPKVKPPAPKPAPPPAGDDLLDLEPLDLEPVAAPAKPPPPKPKPPEMELAALDDLVPLTPAPPVEEVFDLEPVEDLAPLTPVPAAKPPAAKPPSPPKPPAAAPPKPAARPPAAAAPPPPMDLEPIADLQPIGGAAGLAPAPIGDDLFQSGGLQPLGGDAFGNPGAAADPFGAGGAAGGAAPPPPPKKRLPTNRWDSPLLYIGTGVLLLFVVAFVLLLATLTRGNAAEVFAKAEEQYNAGSYTVAIDAYEKFIKSFPDDPNAPLARVRRGMAQLRQTSDIGSDPRSSLKVAQEVLPVIENEARFDAARLELASILPEIADGLATQEKTTLDNTRREQLVKLVEEALALVNNPSYIPSSQRTGQQNKIDGVQEKLTAARRSIDQDKELATVTAEMKTATDAGKAVEAYKLRAAILAKFPGLESHPRLIEAVTAISNREKELVQTAAQELAAETDDPQADRVTKIPAVPEGQSAPTAADQVAAVLIKGAVYGIAARTGKPIWRRHLGLESTFHPVRVDKAPAADILVVDAKRKELLRLAAATGKLRWRLPVGSAFFGPIVAGEKAYLTTAGGELWEVELDTGHSNRRAKLPQAAGIGPAIGVRNTLLYQMGADSTLFVLGTDDLSCRETMYLAHRSGSLLVPPLAALGQLFVVENGSDYSLIHVVSGDAAGLSLTRPVEPIRLKGRVTTPGFTARNRVVFATDLGEVLVLEVDGTNRAQPVAIVGRGVATERSPVALFPLTDSEQLWIAGRRLDKYEIQGSLQQTARKWSMHAGETFIAPLQLYGETLVHVRQRGTSEAVIIEACRASDGVRIWQLELGAPMVGIYGSQDDRIVAVSRAGRAIDWRFDARGGGELASGSPAAQDGLRIGRGAMFGRDIALFQSQSPAKLLIQPISESAAPARVAPLDADLTSSWQQPLPFLSGVLLPGKDGEITLVKTTDFKEMALPFLPSLTPNAPFHWHRPTLIGAEQKILIAAADDGRIFRLAVKDKPRPHLASIVESKLAERVIGPLAAVGDSVFAVVRRDDADVVIAIDPASLKKVGEWPQTGRAAWGPEACGDAVAIGLAPGGLVCVDAERRVRWSLPAEPGVRFGSPTAADKDWLVPTSGGEILRVTAATGEILERIRVGEPVGSAMLVLGKRLVASAADGTLLILPLASGT